MQSLQQSFSLLALPEESIAQLGSCNLSHDNSSVQKMYDIRFYISFLFFFYLASVQPGNTLWLTYCSLSAMDYSKSGKRVAKIMGLEHGAGNVISTGALCCSWTTCSVLETIENIGKLFVIPSIILLFIMKINTFKKKQENSTQSALEAWLTLALLMYIFKTTIFQSAVEWVLDSDWWEGVDYCSITADLIVVPAVGLY